MVGLTRSDRRGTVVRDPSRPGGGRVQQPFAALAVGMPSEGSSGCLARLPTTMWLAVAILGLALSACKTDVTLPSVLREPDVVGEVLSREPVVDQGPEERRYTLVLSNGDALDLDLNHGLRVGGGPAPDEGFLLLYGTEPDGPWFWSRPLRDDPRTGGQCAEIMAPALDEGETIAFEIGLRLPKAEGFDSFDVTDGRFTDPTQGFCLNERGEVTRYRS